jgi:hypothetical protein
MPALQLQIDGKRQPTEYEDFGKADKAIRALVKAGKISDSADIRIVPVLKTVPTPSPEMAVSKGTEPVPETVRVIREKYVRAPHHNTVMTTAVLIGMALGWGLHYVV